MSRVIKSKYSSAGELLFLHADLSTKKTEFITKNDFLLQVGKLIFPKNYSVRKHKHSTTIRKIPYTAEVLFVVSGKIKYRIWDYLQVSKMIEEGIASKGEVLVLGKVGHSFETLSKVKIIEVKQGPYLGRIDKLFEEKEEARNK